MCKISAFKEPREYDAASREYDTASREYDAASRELKNFSNKNFLPGICYHQSNAFSA